MTVRDATHVLCCSHCIGTSCYDYTMPCIVLKKMSGYRLKVLVFGDRYWKRDPDRQRVRYVAAWRVRKVKP